MSDSEHIILCVDDEQNILSALKRLLRKEGYRLLTAQSGQEGLQILEENDVHLVISDQRMPEMNGTDFLATVREKHPDTIRIVLTGYTEVDAITEAINKGNIYKFFLKPWNDQGLKLEIKQALEQYDLVRKNKDLDRKIMEQNEELKRINENLEHVVRERTEDLQLQNQVLELSRAMLEDVPVPIVGVSAEGTIVILNQKAQQLSLNGVPVQIGRELADYLSPVIQEDIIGDLENAKARTVDVPSAPEGFRRVDVTPLSGRFKGRGAILTFGD
jgi:response regulator RpfG family c-di-GMP phosphodiesterase